MNDIYTIHSQQQTTHRYIQLLAKRHCSAKTQRPISEQQHAAFAVANEWLKKQQKPLILDAGCGKGMSIPLLAKQHPQHCILGVDKSIHRLQHNHLFTQRFPLESQQLAIEDCLLLPANLVDFWQLAINANWRIDYHYLLYPNPWPKIGHVKRRWHGHPAFANILRLSATIIVRSNWLLYLEEFALAVNAVSLRQCTIHALPQTDALTHFERKYWAANITTYELRVTDDKEKEK